MNCHYPPPTNGATCTNWQVFESCWRLYKRGETGPMEGGVLPRTLADAVDTTRNVIQKRCTVLVARGVLVKLDTLAGDPLRPVVSWAPAALVEESPKPVVPGGPLR
ncbi:hypothetical protein [Halorarum salinum]|uniref:Helix-turn-helix domain-containing protein n=1 Tax=Halorarum salinum TaxID=2743089 RepID=A0A7D5LBG5_9EURY|nr:hypothetical protein [Halobaculum salinum]QLG62813.1 hypothetical protein HUG12_14190 [Halobaculum salinum]